MLPLHHSPIIRSVAEPIVSASYLLAEDGTFSSQIRR